MDKIINEILPELREAAPSRIPRRIKKQLDLWAGKTNEECVFYSAENPFQTSLPDLNFEEVHYNSEKMFLAEFKHALGSFFSDSDSVPSMRSNMGCGLIGGLFGLTQKIYPEKLPWLQERLTKEQISALEPGDFKITDEYKMAFEHMRYAKELLRGTGIAQYPVDLQGPVDSAHLIYGDEFFYELYDDPGFINHLFDLVHAALIKIMTDCFEIIEPVEFVAHYNSLILPAETPLKISEDTSTLLGKEHIYEYCVPRTAALLEHFGGGYIHYCGVNPHLYEAVTTAIPGVVGLNFGNPEKHDIPFVLNDLSSKGQFYFGGGVEKENVVSGGAEASYLIGPAAR